MVGISVYNKSSSKESYFRYSCVREVIHYTNI